MNILKEILKLWVYLLSLSLFLFGVLFGMVFSHRVFPKLEKAAEKTKWVGDNLILRSTRGYVVLWFSMGGAYAGLQVAPFPPNIVAMIQKILLVLLIFSLTLVGARVATGFVQLYAEKTHGVLPSTSIFVNLTKAFIITLGLLMILQSLGISITPLLTALGVGGLAVALALQETLSNLFSGLHIILSRQVRKGDYVRLDSGEEGYVVDITWRNTAIRTLPNNIVVVPNFKLASVIVTNFYLPETQMAVLVQVGVSYDSDLEHVERVTIEVAKEVLSAVVGGVADFDPFIRYHTFSDFSINFTVILRAREFVDQYLLKHEFIKRLHKRYREEGIEIPYPIRTIYTRNGLSETKDS